MLSPPWPSRAESLHSIRQTGASVRCYRLLRSQHLQACAVLCGFLLVFFWAPITTGGVYSSADLLQMWPIHRISGDYVPKNTLPSDVVFVIQPDLLWNRDELRAGELPIWDPLSGSGAPHLASYQSAVFSPFSLPFYLLDFKLALTVAAFAKLFVLGLFTYLFLTTVRVGHWIALISAVGFMFGGYNVLWLSWAHVGAGVALPGTLYFGEKALQADPRTPAARWLFLLGMALVLAAGLLAGHPETFVFSAFLAGCYLLCRLICSTFSWSMRLRLSAELCVTAVVAVALSAVQLIPFLEYVGQSSLYVLRAAQPLPSILPENMLPLLAFPNALGDVGALHPALASGAVGVSYIEANGSYIGLTLTFLALLAVLLLPIHRSWMVAFFAGFSALTLMYIYNLGGFTEYAARLRFVHYAAASRGHILWLFGVACAAGIGLDRILKRRDGVQKMDAPAIQLLTAVLAAAAVLLLGVSFVGVYDLVQMADAHSPASSPRAPGSEFGLAHVALVTLTYAFSILCIGLLPLLAASNRGRLRSAVLAGLCCLVFLQTGYELRDFNPTIAPQYFYPVSPALAEIQQQVGQSLVMRLDSTAIPANANVWYGIRGIANYDGMGVKVYDDLVRALLIPRPFVGEWASAAPANLRALQVMGVQYVTTATAAPFAVSAIASPAGAGSPGSVELLPDRAVRQTFGATVDNLDSLSVMLTAFSRANTCELKIDLQDVTDDLPIKSLVQDCSGISDGPVGLEFPPIPDSKGKMFRLTLQGQHASAGNAVGAVIGANIPGGGLRLGDEPIPGGLVIQAQASTIVGLTPVWSDGTYRLFGVPDPLPQYFTVGKAVTANTDQDAITMLLNANFDPRSSIVAPTDAPQPLVQSDVNDGSVTVVQDRPTHVTLAVRQSTPGYLVALKTYYPGWYATVNGQPTPLIRSDVAFMSVPVPAGDSAVELTYDPISVRIGLVVSGMALFVCLVAGLTSVIMLRRTARSARALDNY